MGELAERSLRARPWGGADADPALEAACVHLRARLSRVPGAGEGDGLDGVAGDGAEGGDAGGDFGVGHGHLQG